MILLDYNKIKSQYADKIPPWGPVGYVTFKRTYALRLDPANSKSPTEEWWQTCLRMCNGIQQLGANFHISELERLYHYFFNLKGLLSGRSIFKLGTPYVSKFADALISCWFVKCDQLKAFEFTFNQLMLGGGVGFSVRAQDIYKLPRIIKSCSIKRVDANDADFIVPDTRQGWIELVHRTLDSFFHTGKDFIYSLHCIRSKGAPIKGFGGTASGPDHLDWMIQTICKILNRVYWTNNGILRTVDVLDIQNLLGACTKAGNVRRSAEIALGDPSDYDYLDAKLFSKMPNWRVCSNNSISTSDIESIANRFWQRFEEVDERGNAVSEVYGLHNPRLCKEYGRLGEEAYDPSVEGINPCGEITLGNFEACNLVELFLQNFKDYNELLDCAKLLFRCAKTICCQNFEWEETNKIVHQNMRIGCSVGAILQHHNFDAIGCLDQLNQDLESYDEELSSWIGVPKSIRRTTIEPSGTKSLLSGCTHGIHGYYSEYAIRRIQMSAHESLAQVCREHGYKVEPLRRADGSYDFDSVIVEFPVKAPTGAIISENQSAIDQLENIKLLQTVWADNAVSCTVTYKPHEVKNIKEWLIKNYKDSIKTVSFLKYEKHGFAQAPYEPITKDQYEKLKRQTKPIISVGNLNTEVEDDQLGPDCEGGICQAR